MYVNVKRPEIPPKRLLLLNPNVLEVLVTEDDNAPLSDQQGQFVLLQVGKLRQLQPPNLSPNHWCELGDLEVGVLLGKEVWLVLVGDEAPVVELKGLKRREFCLFIVHGEVGGVFVLL